MNSFKNLKSSSGQFVVEYVLLLVVVITIGMIISKQLVSRNEESPGFLIDKWNNILTTIGADPSDDLKPKKKESQ